MTSILFIDRDGTILMEPDDFQIDRIEKFTFVPGAIEALRKIAKTGRWTLLLVSNQDGLGSDAFPLSDFTPLQDLMLRILAGEGIVFDEIHIDKSWPQDQHPNRKPGTGMLMHWQEKGFDKENSFVIGDRITDLALAKNLGCKGIFLRSNSDLEHPDFCSTLPEELAEIQALETHSWDQIVTFLTARRAQSHRISRETDVYCSLVIDGSGKADIATGLGFFDHMLQQLATHGGMDVNIRAKGDLHVDEHHLMEDVGITLGEVFKKALGDKQGIQRYGFEVPMDEARAGVRLDLGGRYHFRWKAKFSKEKIGDVPTDMLSHFFSSFAMAAGMNLHMRAAGSNDHHVAEALFKAWSRALKQACLSTTSSDIPSSKGML